MEVTTRELGGCTVLRVAGRLDATSAAAFDKGFADSVARGTKNIVLDFSVLEYISSAGLRSVLGVKKKLKSIGGDVAVAGLAGAVKEVFVISGIDSLLCVRGTAEEAAASL
jgi:anti-anti-sigma factor